MKRNVARDQTKTVSWVCNQELANQWTSYYALSEYLVSSSFFFRASNPFFRGFNLKIEIKKKKRNVSHRRRLSPMSFFFEDEVL